MITDLTPEQVAAANVDNLQQPEDLLQVEQQIQQAVKGYTFSMKLNAAQKDLMERFASVLDMTWQDYMRTQIQDKILGRQAQVGGPLITGPSFARGSRIHGPQR
jgi:hypothetical protein